MHTALNNAGGWGWEGEDKGMFIQEVPSRGDCLPLAVMLAMWSQAGNTEQAWEMREQIGRKMVDDESIKAVWERSFRKRWHVERMERGGNSERVDEEAMERDWQLEVSMGTGRNARGRPEFLAPIHVKTLAMIIGRPIIVVAASDRRFKSEGAPGQTGGIYRPKTGKIGANERKMRAVVLGYANAHFGVLVKKPDAHRAQSVQIGQKGKWGMVRQFEDDEDEARNDFMHAVEDRNGRIWADMFMGGRGERHWETNVVRMKKETGEQQVKSEPESWINDRKS
jgi:hypothetical protein